MKLQIQVEKLTASCDKSTEKNEGLIKRKDDLSKKYQALHEENLRIITTKENELEKLESRNKEIQLEIDSMTEKHEHEMEEAQKRIERLMKISEATKIQIREEKANKQKYQRSVFTLQHLYSEHQKLKQITEGQEKRLGILLGLLEASKEHLSKSIEQKSLLLNQTSEAAEKMSLLCEETLQAEQKFYEERDFDVMHTPPFIKVKRRPRKM
jgi:hypothetical protein